jgi:demethylmenaquinone methyltransferase/2-methoxy-6-polyprenyl-1,4-benzoquinol methylase
MTPLARVQGAARGRWWRDTAWLFNLGADVYDWFTNQQVWRSSCARMAALLPDREPLLVADLGCGPGTSAIELARLRPAARVIGLDVADRMLRLARRRARAAGIPPGRLAFTLGDAARLPFGTGSVDVVTGHSFLYQVPNRAATLAEALRVLRPGGHLLLMEPNERPTPLRRVIGLGRDPRHLIAVGLWRPFSRLHGRFTRASLAATLAEAGFVRCHVEETLAGLGLLASARKPA